MFLSRIEMNWDAARNPYDIHRKLWRMFPGQDRESRRMWDEKRQGFLFRLEEYCAGKSVRILLQSSQAPKAAVGLKLVGVQEFRPQPSPGQVLAFILTANPVKTIRDGRKDSKPSKKTETCRVPLLREDNQREWLLRKLEGAAEVVSAVILPHAPVYFRKGARGGKLAIVTFEGRLRVNDPAALPEILEKGVGPAKAFGCGLLLVRRT